LLPDATVPEFDYHCDRTSGDSISGGQSRGGCSELDVLETEFCGFYEGKTGQFPIYVEIDPAQKHEIFLFRNREHEHKELRPRPRIEEKHCLLLHKALILKMI
jgi:hypothetical protein